MSTFPSQHWGPVWLGPVLMQCSACWWIHGVNPVPSERQFSWCDPPSPCLLFCKAPWFPRRSWWWHPVQDWLFQSLSFSISSHKLQEGAFLMMAEQDLPVDRTECCQESFHCNAPLFSSRSGTYLVTDSWPPEQCQAWVPSCGMGFEFSHIEVNSRITFAPLLHKHTMQASLYCRFQGLLLDWWWLFSLIAWRVCSSTMNTSQ